jgi:prepilin-type N-terminal cleavage/methylation domain-containing protein
MKSENRKTRQSRTGVSTKHQQGFTLLEITIALLILTVVTLSAAGLFAYAINYNSGAYDRTLAHAVAQQQMEALRRTPFDSLVTPTQPEPVITSGGRRYRIVTTVCNNAAANCGGSLTLKKITIEITPEGAGANWVRSSVRVETLRAAPSTGAYYQ